MQASALERTAPIHTTPHAPNLKLGLQLRIPGGKRTALCLRVQQSLLHVRKKLAGGCKPLFKDDNG
jgi:hypothetical protein